MKLTPYPSLLFLILSHSQGGISPGCGCSGSLVDDIVTELKARMKARGDTGAIQRAEQTLAQLAAARTEIGQLNQKMDMVMNHLGMFNGQPSNANVPQPQQPMAR